MDDPILEVDDLTIKYETKNGYTTAVSDASFTIEEGRYFGLVGESGCGKSTLAKSILGGLDENGEITSGTIKYRGEEIQDMGEEELSKEIRWKEISFIPQTSMNSLDPLQRVSEQATEIAQVHTDMDKEEALDRLLDLFDVVGLQESRIHDYPHQFSGGMQQRVVIAFSLFLDPALIIADEPTTALDVIMQDQIFKYLDKIKEESDTSLMLITHDISVVLESCDDIAIMHSGQVAETGPINQIHDSPQHPYTVLLQDSFPDIRNPDKELAIIEGHPPQTGEEVNYCTFVDRCPWATEVCRESAPPLENPESAADSDQLAACFHTDKVSQQSTTRKPEK